jgi:hypothetical protein
MRNGWSHGGLVGGMEEDMSTSASGSADGVDTGSWRAHVPVMHHDRALDRAFCGLCCSGLSVSTGGFLFVYSERGQRGRTEGQRGTDGGVTGTDGGATGTDRGACGASVWCASRRTQASDLFSSARLGVRGVYALWALMPGVYHRVVKLE